MSAGISPPQSLAGLISCQGGNLAKEHCRAGSILLLWLPPWLVPGLKQSALN